MLGRRRGRKGNAPQDESASGNDPEPSTPGGAVKLVEDPPPAGAPADDPFPVERSTAPEGSSLKRPTPIKKTSSDVATAHAELDSVLPPLNRSAAEQVVQRRAGESIVVESVAAPDATATPPPPAPSPTPVGAGTSGQAPSGPADQTDGSVVEDVPVKEAPAPTSTDIPAAEGGLPEDTANSQAPAEPSSGTFGSVPQAASGNPLPRVLAVANQKGGVGKTTTSVNLGAALAELGFRVLVIDLDPQGNATTGLGVDARHFELSMYDVMMRDASLEDCVEPTSMKNLFVAPATIALAGAEIELVPAFSRELKLKRSIESILDDFDFVLID